MVIIQNDFNISQNVTTVLKQCASEVPVSENLIEILFISTLDFDKVL